MISRSRFSSRRFQPENPEQLALGSRIAIANLDVTERKRQFMRSVLVVCRAPEPLPAAAHRAHSKKAGLAER